MRRNNPISSINIFIRYIYENSSFKFSNIFKRIKHRISVRKFRNNILRCSPDFEMLWQMADFIKLSEVIFFYDNSMSNLNDGLYSSKNFPDGQNGFRVFNNEFKVTIKLLRDSKRVCLELDRLKGDKSKRLMMFTNNTWDTTPTIYDEMLLEQVIKDINCKIINLFDKCYEKYN